MNYPLLRDIPYYPNCSRHITMWISYILVYLRMVKASLLKCQ